ncbi:MAG: hypothetical protein JWQ04_3241 [Pedosphaera sp.]|nr:hypothetical protein [Pedosphaera sp.]
MSSHTNSSTSAAPLDLSKWRAVPNWLMIIGGIGAAIGWYLNPTQFAFSWLLAFMFFLSIGLGGLGFTMLHHLFDAGWSVPVRRIFEQLACLLRWMGLLWLPIAFLAPNLYEWMRKLKAGHPDLATTAKLPLFTMPGFYIVSVICLAVWWWLPTQLRKWSLMQDETGSVECTRKMRQYSAFGIFLFAVTLTFGAIMWVKALEHEWFSTMYGVYYFAGSMWMTMATVYVITLILQRQGPLQGLVHEKTYYFLGSILFAFTVFYAYVTFAQYFIIWNANMPEETFWYVQREAGTWFWVSMIIIFGHFFVPFLTLLRIDVKLKFSVMVPLIIWVWLMHFNDMSFNIMPVLHKTGYHLDWMDLACMAFIGGFLAKVFLKELNSHPIVPQQDPRFAESQDIYVAPDQFVEAATAEGINHKSGGGH